MNRVKYIVSNEFFFTLRLNMFNVCLFNFEGIVVKQFESRMT